ncbi:MAG: hypothetical protein ACKVY0_28260 [Prosthecobacter sp.]|uniref:hypothetical protein n=1 Tax=Prosthecobacter sp. TaxID=1965333 RepID=UPI0039020826
MKILFVAYIRTHFRALISQGDWLRLRGDEVGFYFAARYHGCDEDVRAALESGYRVIVFDGAESAVQAVALWRGRKEPTAFPARSFTGCLLKFCAVKQFYHALFARLKPDIVVLPEENIGYLSHLLVQQAHECDVRVVVTPYTIDNPVEAAEVQLQNPGCIVRGGLRRIFARRYPQWMYEHKGVPLFRLPFPAAAAMQFMGAAPARPWQNICSFADAVAVECEALRSQHAGGGVNSAKLRVTGSCALDKMAAVVRDAEPLKAQLLTELELDPSKPVFLAAIPPDIFKSKQRMVEFIDHAEVVIFWIETLAATGWNVVVNLHPHLNPEVIHLGRRPNVRLCLRPVAELLPLCDVFVACISATIRWAIATAKPVLNYDLYQYGYEDYRSAPGVVHVTTREEFSREVTRITNDDAHREQLSLAQAVVAADWGILDGGSGGRLLALFTELLSSKHSPTT